MEKRYLYKIRCSICNIDYLKVVFPEDVSAGQAEEYCPRCGNSVMISERHRPVGRVITLEEEDRFEELKEKEKQKTASTDFMNQIKEDFKNQLQPELDIPEEWFGVDWVGTDDLTDEEEMELEFDGVDDYVESEFSDIKVYGKMLSHDEIELITKVEDILSRQPLSYEDIKEYLELKKYEVQLSGEPQIITEEKDNSLEIEVGDFLVVSNDNIGDPRPYYCEVRGFGKDEIDGEKYYIVEVEDEDKKYFCELDDIIHIIKKGDE